MYSLDGYNGLKIKGTYLLEQDVCAISEVWLYKLAMPTKNLSMLTNYY